MRTVSVCFPACGLLVLATAVWYVCTETRISYETTSLHLNGEIFCRPVHAPNRANVEKC